jgi:alpha-tubulin suppressor-like RCC1 family protein
MPCVPTDPTPDPRRPSGLRHRHTLVRASTVLVIGALVLAACGSSGGTSPSHGASASASTVYRWGVVGNRGPISQLQLGRPSVIEGIKGKVVQIATSNSDGYALTSTGAVYGWGVNSYGELGDGQLTPYETKAVRVEFPPGVTITSLANPMPFDGGLAIDSSGHAWGWGLNAADDLCLTGLTHKRPEQLALNDVTLATGAKTHALFESQGTVYGCGSNEAGELGNGTTNPSNTPSPVVGLPS